MPWKTGAMEFRLRFPPREPAGTVGTRAVTLGVRKALIEFDELVLLPR